MRPYTQSIFTGAPKEFGDQPGDCMRAAICSVLEINPLRVPNFAEWVHNPKHSMDWFQRMDTYLEVALGWKIHFANRLTWLNQIPGLNPFAVLIMKAPDAQEGHAVVVNRESGHIVHDPARPGQLPRPLKKREKELMYWGFVPTKNRVFFPDG